MKNSSRRVGGKKAHKDALKELLKQSWEGARLSFKEMSKEEEAIPETPSWIDQEQIWTGGSGSERGSEHQKQLLREERLDKVKEVLQKRGQEYGPSQPLFNMLAERWSSTTGAKIQPKTVAMMMIDLKICRMINGKGKDQDTIDDIIGYAVLMGELSGKE